MEEFMKFLKILPFFFLFSFITPVKAENIDWDKVQYHPSSLKKRKIHEYDKKISANIEILEVARIKDAAMKKQIKEKSTPFTGKYLLCHDGISVKNVGRLQSGEIEKKVEILTVTSKAGRTHAGNTTWKLSNPSIPWAGRYNGKCFFITPAYGSGVFQGWQPKPGGRVGVVLYAWFIGSEKRTRRSKLTWIQVPTKEGITTGTCPADKKIPNWKTVDQKCVPSCGAAKGQYCLTNDCEGYSADSGDNCSDDDQRLVAHDVDKCCLKKESRSPASDATAQTLDHGGVAGGGDAGRPCSPEQKEPHWKEVDGQCLPSCGAAKGAYCSNQTCKGLKLASCKKAKGNSLAIRLEAHDNKGCCLIEERERKKEAGTYPVCKEGTNYAWYPSASNVCEGVSFIQWENCRRNGKLTTRQASGTAPSDVWIPSTGSVCEGNTFTQRQNCRTGGDGYGLKTRLIQGSKKCRAPASVEGGTAGGGETASASACPANKKEPHWKAVNGQCLPSCGASKGQYCKTRDCQGFTLASGSTCSKPENSYRAISLDSYQGLCCLIKNTPPAEGR